MECGAVAQLGERRDGIAKVWGSIPHGSTIQNVPDFLAFTRTARATRCKIDDVGIALGSQVRAGV